MALTTTTLSAAVAIADNTIAVTSATSFVAGMFIKIDDETLQITKNYVSGTTIPVLRGLESATATHKSGANVTIFLASDEAGASAQTFTQWPAVKARRMLSYSASGAVTLPNPGEDMVAVFNGTSVL